MAENGSNESFTKTVFVEYRGNIEIGVEVFLAVLINLLAIFINILIITVIRRDTTLNTTANRFIESLVWTDIVNSFAVTPFFVINLAKGNWIFGTTICRAQGFFLISLALATLYNVTAIAVTRYLKVVRPLLYLKTFGSSQQSTVFVIIIALWTVACFIPAAAFMGFGDYEYSPSFYVCTAKWSPKYFAYLIIVNFVSIYPATITVVVCYIAIYIHHHASANRLLLHAKEGNNNDKYAQLRTRAAEVRLFRSTTSIVCVYLLCWLPIGTVVNLKYNGVKTHPRVDLLAVFCEFLTSCLNPALYGLVNPQFRRALLNMAQRHNNLSTNNLEDYTYSLRFVSSKLRHRVPMSKSSPSPKLQVEGKQFRKIITSV